MFEVDNIFFLLLEKVKNILKVFFTFSRKKSQISPKSTILFRNPGPPPRLPLSGPIIACIKACIIDIFKLQAYQINITIDISKVVAVLMIMLMFNINNVVGGVAVHVDNVV